MIKYFEHRVSGLGKSKKITFRWNCALTGTIIKVQGLNSDFIHLISFQMKSQLFRGALANKQRDGAVSS